jgi:hypothetical protein
VSANVVPIRYNPQRDHVRAQSCGRERDLSSRAGSIQHAAELNEWWAQRGFPQVKWEAVQRSNLRGYGSNEPTWTVTSNLINGLPPKVTP